MNTLRANRGLIGGVHKTSGVATIVNASWLQRAWEDASENNDDARARDYIADVRVYCEDLLKFMLRGEGPAIPDLSLDGLKKELKRLKETHVPPFDRRAFVVLLNTLSGGGGNPMKLINVVHHRDDETLGLAEASTVKAFWEKTLMNQIHDAFAVYDRFESFYGEPRTFPWAKTMIPFPGGFREDVKAITLQNTGIAAAKTGGRAGDGVVTVTERELGYYDHLAQSRDLSVSGRDLGSRGGNRRSGHRVQPRQNKFAQSGHRRIRKRVAGAAL